MKNATKFALLIYFVCMTSAWERSPARLTARPACPFPSAVPNGSFRMRRNNQIMRISCRPGYNLQGDRIVECINGKWVGQKPVCAKSGCDFPTSTPEHGFIQLDSAYRIVLFCLDNYNLAGNRYAYCNGTDWDRPIGNCREPSYNVEHECDFETDDICGWVHEEGIGTHWRRVTAMNIYTSYHTGPRHDHTLASITGGHYMLMETVDPTSEPAYLQSPIYEHDLSLKTACCFRFFYFMYGAGVGDLTVFVRPVSVKISDLLANSEKYEKFKKSGNQNNLWNEAHFSISELNEDFQIVFVATAGKNHLSDIAIDDVRLMTGEDCTVLNEDNSGSEEEEATEETIFDTQSCEGRCFEGLGSGFVRRDGHLFGRCNCDFLCEFDESCCPDYRFKCLNPIFQQSTEESHETSNSFELESKEQPTTRLQYFTTTPTTTSTSTTKRTTKTSTTTTTTTTTTTSTPKLSTTSTTISTTTPRSTTTIKVTTPKTTPATSTTSTLKTSSTAATSTRVMPPTSRLPNKNTVNRTEALSKEEIAVWSKGKVSNRNQHLPHSGHVLLICFFVIVVTILASTLVYRFKDQMSNWLRGANRRDDKDSLIDDNIETENEANFGIDNKLALSKATKSNPNATSISTNL